MYPTKLNINAAVVIVRVGTGPWVSDRMEKSLQKHGVAVDVLKVNKSDDIGLPNLIQILSRKSIFDLVQEVL